MNDQQQQLTVKEYAALERVTDRTVRTWVAKGAVPFRRTPSGNVRILIAAGMKFPEEPGNPSR